MHELFGKPFLSRPHGVRWVLHDGRVHWTVIDGHPRPRVTIGSVGSGSKHLALVCSFGTLVAASPAVPNLMLDEFRTPEHIQIASPGSGVLPAYRVDNDVLDFDGAFVCIMLGSCRETEKFGDTD